MILYLSNFFFIF